MDGILKWILQLKVPLHFSFVRFQWQVQKIWKSFEKGGFQNFYENNLFFCWISFILSVRRRVGHVGTALYIDSSSLNKLFIQVMFWRFKQNYGARNRMKNFFLNAMGAFQLWLILNLNSHTCNDWNSKIPHLPAREFVDGTVQSQNTAE